MAPEGAARLAATLDIEPAPGAGDELPMLWHWAYFHEPARRSNLGTDGHVLRHDALAGRLPRRLAASGRTKRVAPLVIGRPAQRDSVLLSLAEKDGRSGRLAFANWRHVIKQDGAVTVEEMQTVVYRGPATAGSGEPAAAGHAPSAAYPGTDGASLRREVRFDTPTLFRFSAVTWNSHRIHYDLDYATKAEGYPGLVVHGPLLAMLLAGEATAELGGLGAVEYRARAPVFADDAVQIFAGDADGGALALEARKFDGTVAMTMVASPAP